jgi:chromate transporter
MVTSYGQRLGSAVRRGALGAAGVDHDVGLRQAFRVWAKVAVNSFGGPAGQITVMHRFLVEERRWISEERFLHALNFCMLLPGPEAQQLAIYIGWLMHGSVGGLMAGALFVLPGAAAILVLSTVYAVFGDVDIVSGLFFGLRAAVVAVVIEAVLRIGRRALKTPAQATLAVAAFLAIFFAEVAFPLIVLAAGIVGYVGGHLRPAAFVSAAHGGEAPDPGQAALIADDGATINRSSARSALRAAAVALVLWLLPVLLIVAALGTGHVFAAEAMLFSKSAVVTFGGAYAVLAYIAQQAVSTYGWLRPGEMLTGLGMAETTPGPLIMVVQFVGFMAAFRNPGSLDPLLAGVLGSAIATWVTFAPCFFFIFAGAPFIERLRGNRSLSVALSAITAAVVGVVLNLAVWFFLNTAFERVDTVHRYGLRLLAPRADSLNIPALAITLLAVLAIFRLKISVGKTLLACAVLGLLVAVTFGVAA